MRRLWRPLAARAVAAAAVVASTACLPKLTPLTGEPLPATRLPRAFIAPGHHKVVFNWEVSEYEMTTRGEGAARLAAPDSARLDFFLGGGFGNGGVVVVIGDSLRTPPGADTPKGLIPSATLLWAALGRVALPNLPDTVIRVEGTTLRADIGRPTAWRLSFHGDSLFRVERVQGDRVAEWVDRSDPSRIKYRNEGARRTVQLTITRTDEGGEFDAAIWRFDR